MDNGLVASGRNILVVLAGRSRLLLEAVQYINRFGEFGDIHNAEASIIEIDADLLRSCTNAIERLPVVWFKSGLNKAELMPSLFAGIGREYVVILDIA